jgi:uncharacterized protein
VPLERSLAILLISGTYERAHYAFVLAAGAAAIGRRVTMFATNAGCHALCRDWSDVSGATDDDAVSARGVAGFATLRDAAIELGVRLIACEAGLKVAGIASDALLAGVEVAGVATFLEAADTGQIISL